MGLPDRREWSGAFTTAGGPLRSAPFGFTERRRRPVFVGIAPKKHPSQPRLCWRRMRLATRATPGSTARIHALPVRSSACN